MPARRILYVTDNPEKPTGGTIIAREHVRILVRNGFDAALLVRRDMQPDYYDAGVPVIAMGESFTPDAADILVIPEPWNDVLTAMADKPGRKVVFCQNHHYVYYGLGAGGSYDRFNVSTVFSCGQVIAGYLRTTLGLARVPVVHNGIDTDLFRPERNKRRQIAVMPRKMPVEANFIRETFRRRHPRYARLPWVTIDGVPRREVARILAETPVFLALGRLEGFGLPPLEAMASLSLVVGFTGGGGDEFATADNGFWCRAEDWIGCADALARAMDLCENPVPESSRRLKAGLATARRYGLDRMERELLAFWREETEL
ncbi:glycosyltransferase [Azospirillum halopraeferens]|uniref:glycosyltransferase n=1 Tax=Azospirillum halopraeferens TaxID=34010 RepID=UPI0004105A99|nr:glycosyltransferase [Azospirillum halopraeferens]